jgi:hypothetical protein
LAGIVIVSVMSVHAFCGGTERLHNAATSSNLKSIGIALVVALARIATQAEVMPAFGIDNTGRGTVNIFWRT